MKGFMEPELVGECGKALRECSLNDSHGEKVLKDLSEIRSPAKLWEWAYYVCETATVVAMRWSAGDCYIDVGMDDYQDITPLLVMRRLK